MNQTTGSDKLNEIKDGLHYLIGRDDISIREMITDEFVSQNTDFDSFQRLLKAAGAESEKDLDSGNFDGFITKHTHFESWKELLETAANKFAARNLG